MKKVVSISLGSSKRNHEAEAEFLGEKFKISRIGADGDLDRAIHLLQEIDGKVDAIGLGGIDIYLYARDRVWELADGVKMRDAVKKTPVVDGSGLKHTLEREVIRYLDEETDLGIRGKTVFVVSAVDRYGMAEAFTDLGCKTIFGDLMFALGVDKAVFNLDDVTALADDILPRAIKKPFYFLYPVGEAQDRDPIPKFVEYYLEADIIAGDYLFIRKHMPDELKDKIIITNTTTPEDVEQLRKREVKYLITTTPVFNGRSFGTNVIEAIFVVLINKPLPEIKREDYIELIKKINLKPRIERLN